MLDAVELFARGQRVGGRGMGLVAMTGGQSVVITDTFATAGLEDAGAVGVVVRRAERRSSTSSAAAIAIRSTPAARSATGHHQGNLDRILEILERDPVDRCDRAGESAPDCARRDGPRTRTSSPACSTSWRSSTGRSTKPFAVVMHPAHVEAIVARGKELARSARPGGVRQFRARGRRFRRRRRVLAGQGQFVTYESKWFAIWQDSSAESLRGASFGLRGFLFSILRRRVRFERSE